MAESIATGEEIRDDTRNGRVLPPEVLRELTRLEPLRSTLSLLTTLAVIAATSNTTGVRRFHTTTSRLAIVR